MKYVGNGRYIQGVPARDLTEEEVAELSMARRRALVKSGVYKMPRKKRKRVKEQPNEH